MKLATYMFAIINILLMCYVHVPQGFTVNRDSELFNIVFYYVLCSSIFTAIIS